MSLREHSTLFNCAGLGGSTWFAHFGRKPPRFTPPYLSTSAFSAQFASQTALNQVDPYLSKDCFWTERQMLYYEGAETWHHQPWSSVGVATTDVTQVARVKVEVEPPGLPGPRR